MDGSSSEISAITTEALFNTLKLAPMRLGLPDHPTPTSYHLAHNYYPTSVDICKKVLSALNMDSSWADSSALRGNHDQPDPNFNGPF